MNWYFEASGVSQGPLAEEELATRVGLGEISAETLVWSDGMEEWQPIAQARPIWLERRSAPVKESAAAIAKEEPPAASPVPPARNKPLAPSKKAPPPPPEPATKQGLFSRLFGGKKKTK